MKILISPIQSNSLLLILLFLCFVRLSYAQTDVVNSLGAQNNTSHATSSSSDVWTQAFTVGASDVTLSEVKLNAFVGAGNATMRVTIRDNQNVGSGNEIADLGTQTITSTSEGNTVTWTASGSPTLSSATTYYVHYIYVSGSATSARWDASTTNTNSGTLGSISANNVYRDGVVVNGFFLDMAIIGSAATSNTAPGISGTVASQAVNDNATVSLFSGVSITDSDGDNVTATITLDDNAKGVITGADAGSGPYTMNSRTAAAMATAIQALSFNPTDNRTTTSETTTFTLTINDGTVDTDDNTTTVVSSAVVPTLSSSSPTNGSTGVSASGNITLIFSEDINFGSGNIQIIDTDDNSNSFTIDVNSNAGQLSITDKVLTINPSTDLAKGTNYAIQIASTALTDDGGKAFAGISNNTILAFKTAVPTSLEVAATVYLEGAYNTTDNDLNTTLNSLIPTTQPFGFNDHASGTSTGSIPASAVDWIVVELRESTTGATVGSASGFLMSDGSTKATNGTDNLEVTLSSNSGISYYVIIYHKNHIPIMSALVLDGSSGTLTIDFTDNQSKAFGTNAMKELETGVYGMFAGDADGNLSVEAADLSTWRTANGAAFNYSSNSRSDFNLDGVINAVDRNEYQQKNSTETNQVPSN